MGGSSGFLTIFPTGAALGADVCRRRAQQEEKTTPPGGHPTASTAGTTAPGEQPESITFKILVAIRRRQRARAGGDTTFENPTARPGRVTTER